MDIEPEEAEVVIQNPLPQGIKRACGWAFRYSKKEPPIYLPEAFVLPKAKKDFLKARPLIPATRHWLKRLHAVASRILADIARERFGKTSLDTRTTLEAVKALKSFVDRHESGMEGKLLALNRDLAGFYTAIPQEVYPACCG